MTNTLKGLFKKYGDAYRKKHKLPYSFHKHLNAIESCKTERLGAHKIACESESCDYQKLAYNSCRNKHCPSCQSYKSAKWVLERNEEVLPIKYYHVVFTVPHELNQLIQFNKRLMYDILFQASKESLGTLMKDEKYYGGSHGAIAVLHTWGQNLMDHPHVHMIVPGGALDFNNGKWHSIKRRNNKAFGAEFLVPVKPLKILYKNVFLKLLTKAYKSKGLELTGSLNYLCDPKSFYELKDGIYKKDWNVNIKVPFAGAKQVIEYLGRYTHRVAISNSRILSIENGLITFKAKNYKKSGKSETLSLPVEEFIRRFLLHFLPRNFRRIRMFGFLSNRYKIRNLEFIREKLNVIPVKIEKVKRSTEEIIKHAFGVDVLKCPKCSEGTLTQVPSISGGLGTGG
jgi:hypothetical protein